MSNLSLNLVSILYNWQLMKFAGEDGVAAYGVIMYVHFIFISIFLGFCFGVAPVISFHYGAKNHDELKGLLTDIGTEELGHLEMIGAIIHQLTRNLKDSQIQDSAFSPYFVDHTTGVYPTAASGFPWNAASMAVKGDPIADLTEDMAAEQKARVTYDNILRLSDDPDVNNVIKFLREREVVHFQRFGEAMQLLREKLNQKNVYYMNPAFDM
jgi:spore coat protein JC